MANVLQLRPPVAKPAARKLRLLLKPLAVDARGLMQLLPFGLRTIRTMDAAGKLPAPLRISGKVVWRVSEIKSWLAAGAPDRETWEARKSASLKVTSHP